MSVANTLIVIQARLSSTRLPNKILLPLFGSSIISLLFSRLSLLPYSIVVAIPDDHYHLALANHLSSHNIPYIVGSEHNVFERFLVAIKLYQPDIIVRVNSDCPYLSPSTVSALVHHFDGLDLDYLSTTLDSSFPLGEHVEVIRVSAFLKASSLDLSPSTFEHVTPIFYHNPCFRARAFMPDTPLIYPSSLRLCIDFLDDYLFLQEFEKYFDNPYFDLVDILLFCTQRPDLLLLNSSYIKERSLQTL
jgi:spore coat polysaccharide biosynthesis protein SpsF (cytidylyltransferase family)